MITIYNATIQKNLTCEYLDFLINKVFSLLHMFEESSNSTEKQKSFNIYQKILIQKINGNMTLIQYDSLLVIDILSHLQSLIVINDHDNYKRHIFKICNLLSKLKKEVELNGI